eukprot:scaffold705_cov402-Prasinococcus_capsulatus_cf.AAC.13
MQHAVGNRSLLEPGSAQLQAYLLEVVCLVVVGVHGDPAAQCSQSRRAPGFKYPPSGARPHAKMAPPLQQPPPPARWRPLRLSSPFFEF